MADLFENQEQTQFFFASRDSTGGIRGVDVRYDKIEENHYIISRESYKYHCKHTQQPQIDINEGKSNRDAHAQCILRANSICKEYRDKGYKELEKSADEYTKEELDSIIGEFKTDATGLLKPMLCKMVKNVTDKSIFNKKYFASRKIDGIRAMFYWDGTEVRARSRTAIDLDFPLQHILTHPLLIKLFESNPNLILDGEVYHHGMPLNRISGLCRSQKTAAESEILEFYMYDIVDPELTFIERLKKMLKIGKLLHLGFDPYRVWKEGDLKIQLVPQEPISGWDNMMNLHNKYVEEGWEGLVVRLADAKYGPGKRNNNMIKIKIYQDSEFKVIGYELGLRGIEDMVFICVTEDGKQFKAKPMGDRETKQEYIDSFETIYKGKYATCKYFVISEYGIPQQPCLVNFRFDL